MNKQALLLDTLDSDLAIAGNVKIHSDFMSVAARRAIEAGDKERTLGSYVSVEKMKQVADGCTKIHGTLLFSHYLLRSD